jgi:hypothetical protein
MKDVAYLNHWKRMAEYLTLAEVQVFSPGMSEYSL